MGALWSRFIGSSRLLRVVLRRMSHTSESMCGAPDSRYVFKDWLDYLKALFQLLTRLVTLRVPMPVAKSQPRVLL